MTIDLANYEARAVKAVKTLWATREQAKQKQIDSGKVDVGERVSELAGHVAVEAAHS